MITKIGYILVLAEDKKKQTKDYITETKDYIKETMKPEKVKNRLMMAAAVPGALLLDNSLRSGYLTGRATLYHGTLKENIPSILEHGLKATSDDSAVNTKVLQATDPERCKKALGKSYAEKNLINAAGYAYGAENRKNGIIAPRQPSLKDLFRQKDNIVKLNIPLHKLKTVMNPEVDMPYDEWVKKVDPHGFYSEGDFLKRAYKMLRNAVVVDGDIPAEYIPKSEKYVRNNLKEYLEYVKKMPKNALKGVGKAGAGLSLIGLSGYGAYNAFKKDDNR